MSTSSQQIVSKAWSFAHVLRDDGLSYIAYTEQITLLLFLKMADELTRPPHRKPSIVPKGLDCLRRIEAVAPATAQKSINRETLDQVAVCLPPLAEQEQIVAEVERRLSVVAATEAQLAADLRRAARLR